MLTRARAKELCCQMWGWLAEADGRSKKDFYAAHPDYPKFAEDCAACEVTPDGTDCAWGTPNRKIPCLVPAWDRKHWTCYTFRYTHSNGRTVYLDTLYRKWYGTEEEPGTYKARYAKEVYKQCLAIRVEEPTC